MARGTAPASRRRGLEGAGGADRRQRRAASLGDRQAAAFQATFAAALDTDSHAVAEVAAAAGLPLLVVRAVAEPADEMRPAIAAAANGADGQARSLAVVGHLAKRPWEIRAAWRFSKNGRLALEALRRIASIGPGALAFDSG